jgi:hypothetical protein
MMILVGLLTVIAVPAAGQFVAPGMTIPVVANLPGLNNTFWMTDVTVLNLGDSSTDVLLQLFPEIVGGEAAFEPMTDTLTVPARSEVLLSNVLQRFGLFNTKGSLMVYSSDGSPLVITSRTYTFGGCGGGSYGQNVIGSVAANEAFLGGVRHDAVYRTNIGVFWLFDEPGQLTVTVLDPDGSQVAEGSIAFDQAGLQQLSLSDLGVDQLNQGWVQIRCSNPDLVWYAYGSKVDQATGDAVYQAALSKQGDLP